jgi:hypothetical protein
MRRAQAPRDAAPIDVDARDKPGHDEACELTVKPRPAHDRRND